MSYWVDRPSVAFETTWLRIAAAATLAACRFFAAIRSRGDRNDTCVDESSASAALDESFRRSVTERSGDRAPKRVGSCDRHIDLLDESFRPACLSPDRSDRWLTLDRSRDRVLNPDLS